MNKLFTLLTLTLIPSIMMAQAAGGTISRPTYKNQFQNIKKAETNSKTSLPLNREKIIEKIKNNMVFVEGGSFTMGATVQIGTIDYSDSKPIHQVTVSSYFIGRYEVTQEEWQIVMGANPSKYKGLRRPVENISWEDCQLFISRLNEITGEKFRLPTEAEWEFAARGGINSKGYIYSGSNVPDEVAWYGQNTTKKVGQKKANELGIFDMSGNVYEWCQDYYGAYKETSQTRPMGPSSGTDRVLRGGCWYLGSEGCTVFCRHDRCESCSGGAGAYGFRLARSARGSLQ